MITVWDYLGHTGYSDNVYNAFEKLNLPQFEIDHVVRSLDMFDLVINSRAKSRFGCVKYLNHTMELTSEYFVDSCLLKVHPERSDHHKDTLLHEAAHIITRAIWGKDVSSHGKEWKSIMLALGITPARCGSGDFLKKEKKSPKHLYTCRKCSFTLNKNRKLKNMHRRSHIACGGYFDHVELR